MTKRIVPLILIVLIFANLFAPFSVGVNDRNIPTINKNKAEAEIAITVTSDIRKTDTSIFVDISVEWGVTPILSARQVDVSLKDKTGLLLKKKEADLKGDTIKKGTVVFTTTDGVKSDTEYIISTFAYVLSSSLVDRMLDPNDAPEFSASGKPNPDPLVVRTNPAGQTQETGQTGQTSANLEAIMPACGLENDLAASIVGKGTVTGCAAQILYYVIFIPTSYLFALTGKFFDATFDYSINDTSYRSAFVVQGWGVVRDFVNMFFIFVLLYIAISTILNIHGFKTKEMIINVVLIGLVMNFSLFAAQVVIDSSNILARVFYNSDAIKITKGGANGVTNASTDPSPSGQIKLSEALVNKINPQNLIISGARSVKIQDKVGGATVTANDKTGLGAGAFILITLLAVAVNIVGMIVFLSVGLIFVARVIGLWIYMIFAPLAFFSYTVPQMKSMGMVGWPNWWKELLSMSFLAPIFIFFLYLILKFLDTGLGLVDSYATSSGLEFVISIIIPFAFIMILLMKAKSIAKKLSGELGQNITSGVAAVGGLALGGAALGTAFAGRTLISRPMNAMSSSKAAQEYEDSKNGIGSKPKGIRGVIGKIGYNLNNKSRKSFDKTHSETALNTKSESLFGSGAKFKNLSEERKKSVRESITDSLRGGTKEEVRQGRTEQLMQEKYGPDYKTKYKAGAINAMLIGKDIKGRVDKEEKEFIEKSENKIKTLEKNSTYKPGIVASIADNAQKGSFDLRNISHIKNIAGNSVLSKFGASLISGIAGGIRLGLKKSDVDMGMGGKDFFSDLSSTLSKALSKITKDNSHKDQKELIEKLAKTIHHDDDHGGGAKADHGGGGGHH